MEKNEVISLVKNRNFLLLWINQIFTQISYNFVNFALLVWVYQLTHSNFAVSLLILTIIIPTAIFSVFTGVLSDFLDKRKIMFIINLLWAFSVLGFILVHDNVLAILTLSFIINSIDRFFSPAQLASLPSVVSQKELLLANSLFSITLNISFIIGFSLSGPVMLIWGNDSPFVIASISTFIAAGCSYFLPRMKSMESKKTIFKLILDDTFSAIRDGYNFIFDKRVVLTSIISLTLIQVCVNIGTSLGPGYAQGTLGIDVRHASIVFGLPIGIGALLGIYLMNHWSGKILKREMVAKGLLLAGVGILALGLEPLILDLISPRITQYHLVRPLTQLLSISGLTFITALVLGVAYTFLLIPITTTLSENTPEDLRGRVWGVTGMFQNAIASLPLIIFGAVADQISVLPLTFMFAILAFIAYTLSKKKSLEGFFYG